TDEFPEKNFDNHTHYGFIAQEVEEVLPEMVGTNELGYKSIRYIGFTSLLVEALKEQQAEVVKLRDKVEKLLGFICNSKALKEEAGRGEICDV
ncbi:hypothetical protein TrRE_jg8332, partial [Triparma retinervis]